MEKWKLLFSFVGLYRDNGKWKLLFRFVGLYRDNRRIGCKLLHEF